MSTGTGTGTGPAGATPAAGRTGGSPESGLGGELAAAHADHANGDHDDHDDHDDHESDFDYYYEADLQPLGYCKALYAFEGLLLFLFDLVTCCRFKFYFN